VCFIHDALHVLVLAKIVDPVPLTEDDSPLAKLLPAQSAAEIKLVANGRQKRPFEA
jgi:hypothetical protein